MRESIEPVPVVDAQVEAYNARDLDRFLTFFADDAVLRAPDGTESARGLAALSAGYRQWFDGNRRCVPRSPDDWCSGTSSSTASGSRRGRA